VLTILDDDVAGSVQFSAAAYTVGEGASAVAVTVTRTGGDAGGVTVAYATRTARPPPGPTTRRPPER
jgi:hypothetical protein